MTLLHVLLAVLAALPTKVSPIEDTADFRDTVKGAAKLRVYQGLPHQTFEAEKLKKELKRENVVMIAGLPFYAPPVEAAEPEALRQLLGAPATLEVFSGEKKCGGFHADYAVSWEAKGKTWHALVCFGCHEMLLAEGDRVFRYDVSKDGYEKLKETLQAILPKRGEPVKA